MKVKDLKLILENFDPEMEIVMSKDGEGNGFSPLCDVDPDAIYILESTYSGEVYDADWSAEDAGFDWDEDSEEQWEELKKGPRTVVLWPTN